SLILVSSSMVPFCGSTGEFISTLTRTVLPDTSRSSMVLKLKDIEDPPSYLTYKVKEGPFRVICKDYTRCKEHTLRSQVSGGLHIITRGYSGTAEDLNVWVDFLHSIHTSGNNLRFRL